MLKFKDTLRSHFKPETLQEYRGARAQWARDGGSDDKRLIFLTNRGHGIRAGPVGSPLRSFHLLCRFSIDLLP